MSTPRSVYFEALDGENEPTVWKHVEGGQPLAMFRRCDLPWQARELWGRIVEAVTA